MQEDQEADGAAAAARRASTPSSRRPCPRPRRARAGACEPARADSESRTLAPSSATRASAAARSRSSSMRSSSPSCRAPTTASRRAAARSQGVADADHRPAVAELGRTLQRLGDAAATGEAHGDEVEERADDVPEVAAPLRGLRRGRRARGSSPRRDPMTSDSNSGTDEVDTDPGDRERPRRTTSGAKKPPTAGEHGAREERVERDARPSPGRRAAGRARGPSTCTPLVGAASERHCCHAGDGGRPVGHGDGAARLRAALATLGVEAGERAARRACGGGTRTSTRIRTPRPDDRTAGQDERHRAPGRDGVGRTSGRPSRRGTARARRRRTAASSTRSPPPNSAMIDEQHQLPGRRVAYGAT